MSRLRPELPPLPAVMRDLPVRRGYPVPWFVAWIEDGKPSPRGVGEPDFRVIFPGAIETAMNHGKCWICGGQMRPEDPYAFVAGAMCAVNRTSAEPPMHLVCADWSARACPFLVRPHAKRRDDSALRETIEVRDAPGTMLLRNPGVSVVWISRTAGAFRVGDGVLFRMGEPLKVRWYAEGREATREEILRSIETGYPSLLEMAVAQGEDAVRALEEMRDTALELLPAA